MLFWETPETGLAIGGGKVQDP